MQQVIWNHGCSWTSTISYLVEFGGGLALLFGFPARLQLLVLSLAS
jgi:hypothetical protein